MKKVILVLTIVMLVLVATITTVNAASVTVENKEYQTGDTVNVAVSMGATHYVDVTIQYNSEEFTYDSIGTDGFAVSAGTSTPGYIVISGVDTTMENPLTTITLKFKANKAIENAVFTAQDFDAETGEELTTPVAQVTVIEEKSEEVATNTTEENNTTVNPTTDTTTNTSATTTTITDTTNVPTTDTASTGSSTVTATSTATTSVATAAPASSAGTATASTSSVPTRLPQTGVPYITIALVAVVVIALTGLMLKVKNK